MADWGSIPDWVGAAGTAVALVALVLEHRQTRRRQDRLEADIAAKASREHAELVAAWFQVEQQTSATSNITVHVSNRGELAAYEASVSLSEPTISPIDIPVIPPGATESVVFIAVPPLSEHQRPALRFTDALGTRWLRVDATLSKVNEPHSG